MKTHSHLQMFHTLQTEVSILCFIGIHPLKPTDKFRRMSYVIYRKKNINKMENLLFLSKELSYIRQPFLS
jgi:hypothetical protein